VNPALEGYTAAILETVGAEDRARLATDLAAIEQLVERNGELRAALTDTAVPPPARRAVLSELLQGRVSDPARRMAAFAVAAVRAGDVISALSWLHHRSQSHEPIELTLLGHLAARQRIGGYATAVFEETGTAELEEIEDQLFRFARIAESNPPLLAEMTDREIPVAVRQAVVDDLLASKVEPATLRLIRFVVAGGRARDFIGALDWLVERTANARGWRVARVGAAEELDAQQRDALAAALSHMTGGPVELQVILDPDLLGGVVVGIGDLRVDSSVRGKLERLREDGAGRHERTKEER